VLLCGLFRH